MEEVTKDEVQRIADLSKLDFDESAMERFRPTFTEILEYFRQLESVDTEDVEATYHALFKDPLETPLREDEKAESLKPPEVKDQAPEEEDDHFRVPKVIE